jgi:hypothetical protein
VSVGVCACACTRREEMGGCERGGKGRRWVSVGVGVREREGSKSGQQETAAPCSTPHFVADTASVP